MVEPPCPALWGADGVSLKLNCQSVMPTGEGIVVSLQTECSLQVPETLSLLSNTAASNERKVGHAKT